MRTEIWNEDSYAYYVRRGVLLNGKLASIVEVEKQGEHNFDKLMGLKELNDRLKKSYKEYQIKYLMLPKDQQEGHEGSVMLAVRDGIKANMELVSLCKDIIVKL